MKKLYKYKIANGYFHTYNRKIGIWNRQNYFEDSALKALRSVKNHSSNGIHIKIENF